jgi:glycosyltransferase involved in cell wall biosynthesis
LFGQMNLKHAGGMQVVLHDLVVGLREVGWHIEVAGLDEDRAAAERSPGSLQPIEPKLPRMPPAVHLAARALTPAGLRRTIQGLWAPDYLRRCCDHLQAVEKLLAEPGRYDVVISSVSNHVPGMTALLHACHPRVVLIGLMHMAEELRAFGWPLLAVLARRRLGRDSHPYLYRRMRADSIQHVVFASDGWRRQAVAAGLPAAVATTIYFGVPVPDVLARRPPPRARLLWVGRLTPAKGLHYLLPALPALRERYPDLQLTVVAGHGPAVYRDGITRTITRLGLDACVTMLPEQPRDALQQFYRDHDALLFYSPYDEPVALTLLEAQAAGVPVVASHAAASPDIIADRETCVCYAPDDRRSIEAAVVEVLDNADLRDRLAANARAMVERRYASTRMIREYDALFCERALAPATAAAETV